MAMDQHVHGARFLMSPPARFGVHHLLNPWMKWYETVDVARAAEQWERLSQAIHDAGGVVAAMPPAPSSGALTFTRDAAVAIAQGQAVVLRNHGRRGDLEPRHVTAWLRSNNFRIHELPDGDRIDGGNVIDCPEGWLIGIPPGAAVEAALRLAPRLGGGRVLCIPLARPEFAHLDMVLANLAGRGWLAYPPGFVDRTMQGPEWASLLADRPVIAVDDAEARSLACNVVTVGGVVIGGGLSQRLCRAIERLGLQPVPLDLDEFRKAAGGAHCLTLSLIPSNGGGQDHVAPKDDASHRTHRR